MTPLVRSALGVGAATVADKLAGADDPRQTLAGLCSALRPPLKRVDHGGRGNGILNKKAIELAGSRSQLHRYHGR